MTSIVDNKQTVLVIIIVHEVCDVSIKLGLCTFGGSQTFVHNIEVVLVLENLAQSHDLWI